MGTIGIRRVLLVRHRAGRDIDLAADDRLDAGGAAGLIKRDRAVKHAVVGDGDSVHTGVFYGFRNACDAAGAVKQAVFCMQMQVYESHNPFRRLLSVSLNPPACPRAAVPPHSGYISPHCIQTGILFLNPPAAQSRSSGGRQDLYANTMKRF